MFLSPARKSRIEKPLVHQIVTSATIGMNQGMRRQTFTGWPTIGSMTYWGMPNWMFEHPLPDQVDDRDRQDEGQEEGGEDQALHPAAQPAHHQGDAERDGSPGNDREEHEIGGVPDRGLEDRSPNSFA